MGAILGIFILLAFCFCIIGALWSAGGIVGKIFAVILAIYVVVELFGKSKWKR